MGTLRPHMQGVNTSREKIFGNLRHGGTMNAMNTWMAVAIVAGGAAFMLGAWLAGRWNNGQQ